VSADKAARQPNGGSVAVQVRCVVERARARDPGQRRVDDLLERLYWPRRGVVIGRGVVTTIAGESPFGPATRTAICNMSQTVEASGQVPSSSHHVHGEGVSRREAVFPRNLAAPDAEVIRDTAGADELLNVFRCARD
jgi:hypothetical protein